jgi:superfamily II DNA or RNA helicase
VDGLFDAIKEATLSGVWSKGVGLARAGNVALQEASDNEHVYRVKSPGRAVAPSAVLYPKDLEWACDCGGLNDPCEHVVAAVIAAKQAGPAGVALVGKGSAEPELGYRLTRRPGPSLSISRVLVSSDGRESPLSIALSTLVAQRKCPFEPTNDDLTADRILSAAQRADALGRRGPSQGISTEAMEKLLRALAGSKNVRLDGAPVTVSLDPIAPRARVYDQGAEVVLTIERDPRVSEVLDRGVVLADGVMRPLAAAELSGPRLERLPMTRAVGEDAFAELVGKVLPELEKQIDVTVESSLLPKRGGLEKPRIFFDLSPHGHTLSVMPTLVYGDPPRSRVDGDRLLHLSGDVPRRDTSAERALVARLRDELNLVPGRLVHFDGHDASRFALRLRNFQEGARTNLDREIVTRRPLMPRLNFDLASFSVSFELEGDGKSGPEPRTASAESVYRAWRDGLDLVPLEDGGWAPLPMDWLKRYGERVADLLAARRADGELPPFAIGRLAPLCEELGEPPPPGYDRLRPLFEGFESIPERGLPKDLTADLRPYQKSGVDWLSFLREAKLGAVLADDMGLGKTLQALCAVEGPALVVCPRSVVFNWAREIERFRPSLSVNVYHGPRRKLEAADVTITTYAVLRLDIDALSERSWSTVILDEAQAIKNPDSQAARAAFRLADADVAFRVGLSGTPVENRLDELWSLFRFTHPGLLGTRADFDERYGRPIGTGSESAAERLRALTKPFLLRRLKRDVARDLPPRSDVVLTVELEDSERDLYSAIHAAKSAEVIATLEQGGSVMAALEALLRLRQAACHPSLVPGQSAETSSKMEALLDALDDAAADGHKAIVFSQWTSLLDLIEKELTAHQIGFTRLDGSTRDRGAVVGRFQADDGPPVLLSSLKAGGTGLNLTAADHVFLMDPWWNPAAEDQAADRAHRIGQERPVTVYRLIAKDTIEEGMLKLQAKKRTIAEAALSAGGAAGGLTREDLLELLR